MPSLEEYTKKSRESMELKDFQDAMKGYHDLIEGRVIVCDVHETLLDVGALAPLFEQAFGDARVLQEWFQTVLLYSEVATLAGPYSSFARAAPPISAPLAVVAGCPVVHIHACVRLKLSALRPPDQNKIDRTRL